MLVFEDKIMEIKMKHPLHFNMNQGVSYGYLIQLVELFCHEIRCLLQSQKKQLEQAKFKELFCNLLNFFIQDDSDLVQCKKLVKYILNNI